MGILTTWDFWSIIIFFIPLLIVAWQSGQEAFKKGNREAYYLLGFCLMLCAAVYANKILKIRMTGTMGFETEREVLEAKTETVQARDEVRQMKIEVVQAQVDIERAENELRNLGETMYVVNDIVLHGMNYPLSHAFRAAAYREMKKLENTLDKSNPRLKKRVEYAVQQATADHERLWNQYEKILGDKEKEIFLDDYMRKARN